MDYFWKFGIHTLPAIHCRLNCYRAMLKNAKNIPLLSPKFAMSDWEKATRNVIKTCFNNIALSECILHLNQRIIDHIKTHKLGRLYKNELASLALATRCYSLYICTWAFGPRYGRKLLLTIKI